MDNISANYDTEMIVLGSSARKRGLDPDVERLPQAKRRRLARPGNRRKPDGQLVNSVDLPVELVFEIFSLLDPVDLLHLSRISKSWRNLLMTRSSLSVWKAARSNLSNFPDCPDGLNEPQYANLAFGKSCYFCSQTYGNTRLIWAASLRTCGRCLRNCNRFISSHPSSDVAKKLPAELFFLDYFPNFSVAKRSDFTKQITIYVPKDIYTDLLDQYSEAPDKKAWLAQYMEKRNAMKLHTDAFNFWSWQQFWQHKGKK
ncbi:hypothetical protein GALMADRAFT_245613 [Galerina marginata CBS 339.88]|uniref:F-box domain-containing protein n=1 Tax=Galerina marginata (strain CBS 339.88) TaxID=685588 RepID=A0A067T2N1_GALM3|nr:hypothetical protein GALMADRAFT_245613 [Galerina marginata CBS 339.88]